MTNASPQAGPTFGDLAGGEAAPEGEAPAPAMLGPELSNDPAMEAIKTNPIHQARIASELSKERLRKFALQMSQARHLL